MSWVRALAAWLGLALAAGGLAAASAQSFLPARDELLSVRRVSLEVAEAWAEEFLALNPDVASFQTVDPGHIVVTTASGAEVDLFLDNLMARLDLPPKEREAELAAYEATIADALVSDRAPEPDPANILPIVRHQDFLDASLAGLPPDAKDDERPLLRDFPGDAGVILAYDTPNGIAVMSKISMGIDGLTDDEAYAFAVSNFAAFAASFTWVEDGGLRFAELDGEYESSIMLLPDVWTALEAELGGPVAAAIPTRGVLAVGRADSAETIAALRALIEDAALDPYSVSEDVFVRRDGGWAVLE